MKVAAFKNSSVDIIEVNKTLQTQGHDLSACVRSAHSLSLKESHVNTDTRRLMFSILELATELRVLWLQLYNPTNPLPDPTASKLLSVSNVSQLQTMALIDVNIDGAALIGVFSRCQSTLLKVEMTCVCILGDDDNVWRKIFDMLVSMPRLSQIRFQWLQQDIDDIMNSVYDRTQVYSCFWTADKGRDKLTLGLTNLLAAMPKVMN